MDYYKEAEQFQCPVCLCIPRAKVFQCLNGHTVCSKCERKLIDCPICRVPYGEQKIQNLQLEKFLDWMKFPCLYKNLGCEELMDRKSILKHEHSCRFGMEFNLCQLIGYKCSHQFNSKHVDLFLKHLESQHGLQVLPTCQIKIPQSIFQQSPSQNLEMDPILVRSKNIYLMRGFINVTTKSLEFFCISLSDYFDQTVKIEVRFWMASSEKSTKRLVWVQQCLLYSKAEKTLTKTNCDIPLSLLSSFVNKEEPIIITIHEDSNPFLRLRFPIVVTLSFLYAIILYYL